MADRPVALEGVNLGLVVAVTVLWLALGLIVIGPGRSAVSQGREEVAQQEERRDEWQSEFGDAERLSEAAERDWSAAYARMQRMGPSGDAEPALTAWVAGALDAASIRGFQVTRDSSEQEDDPSEIQITSPDGRSSLALRSVRVRVRFDALYEDVSRVLAHIEAPDSAFELRRIELRRKVPEVHVELELDLWTRVEADS